MHASCRAGRCGPSDEGGLSQHTTAPPPPQQTPSRPLPALRCWPAPRPLAGLVPPGHHLAEHFVTTEDGYILRLYQLTSGSAAGAAGGGSPHNRSLRAPGPPACPMPGNASAAAAAAGCTRPAVLMQHALMDSSAGWLLLGPGRALAFQLADAGFDVWLANSRGNHYSRNHTTLHPDDPAFWRFTWRDMEQHDLPALVRHVLARSGGAQLVYVGYSQASGAGEGGGSQAGGGAAPAQWHARCSPLSPSPRDLCTPLSVAQCPDPPPPSSSLLHPAPLRLLPPTPLYPTPQGTTIALAALSSQAALQQRISLAVLLAPVAIVANMRSTPFVLGTRAYTGAAPAGCPPPPPTHARALPRYQLPPPPVACPAPPVREVFSRRCMVVVP